VGKENSEQNLWTNIQKWLLENKKNQEIHNKFKSPNIVTVIEVHRLEWLGHIVRMDGARTVMKLLEGKPERERKKGGPRLRQVDDVESDLRNMGVKRWRSRALDRKKMGTYSEGS
jgi:hypothetical protein